MVVSKPGEPLLPPALSNVVSAATWAEGARESGLCSLPEWQKENTDR